MSSSRWTRAELDAIARDADRLERVFSTREERDATAVSRTFFPDGAPDRVLAAELISAALRVLGVSSEPSRAHDRGELLAVAAFERAPAGLVAARDLSNGGGVAPAQIDRILFPEGAPTQVSPLELLAAQRGAVRRAAQSLVGFVATLDEPPWPDAIERVVWTAIEDLVRVALHATRTRTLALRNGPRGVPAEVSRIDRVWCALRDRLPPSALDLPS